MTLYDWTLVAAVAGPWCGFCTYLGYRLASWQTRREWDRYIRANHEEMVQSVEDGASRRRLANRRGVR